MARRYETVYIFDPALEESAITERLERFHALLTKDARGSLTNVAHWGKRSLAYPIKKKGHWLLRRRPVRDRRRAAPRVRARRDARRGGRAVSRGGFRRPAGEARSTPR